MACVRARGAALVVAVIGFVVASDAAAADPNDSATAAAESLFQDARKLMEAKRFAEACPKLASSHKLAPAMGTLLNLADCYERGGQLASASTRFHEAIALAQRLGRPDREKTARDRADKLEPRLIRISIVVRDKNSEVKLDGNVLDSVALASPVPVDPGKHSIEAHATGKKTFSTTLDASEQVTSQSLEIPLLEDDAALPKAANGENAERESPAQGTDEKRFRGGTQRTVSYALLGAGVVGVGIGTFFGLRTSSKWNDTKGHCTGLECDSTGVSLAADAKSSGTVSTLSFIVGGLLAGGGAALFFTAPSGPQKVRTARADHPPDEGRRVRVGVTFDSVTLGGTFE